MKQIWERKQLLMVIVISLPTTRKMLASGFCICTDYKRSRLGDTAFCTLIIKVWHCMQPSSRTAKLPTRCVPHLTVLALFSDVEEITWQNYCVQYLHGTSQTPPAEHSLAFRLARANEMIENPQESKLLQALVNFLDLALKRLLEVKSMFFKKNTREMQAYHAPSFLQVKEDHNDVSRETGCANQTKHHTNMQSTLPPAFYCHTAL